MEKPGDCKRVLFLCTANSCRSQMAEGFLRSLAPDRFEAFSAGTKGTDVHPLAVRVMEEAGVDISGHSSKTVSVFSAEKFDYVITVCGGSGGSGCPVFTGSARERLAWDFPDPAAFRGSAAEVLACFRQVRDAIKHRVEEFIESGV